MCVFWCICYLLFGAINIIYDTCNYINNLLNGSLGVVPDDCMDVAKFSDRKELSLLTLAGEGELQESQQAKVP